jgi:glucose/mannose transport system substrate-binding protein
VAFLGIATAQAEDIVVFHDWRSPAELAALNVLRHAVEARGDRWIPLAIPHDNNGNTTVLNLIEAGTSPNVFLQMPPDIYRSLNDKHQLLQLDEQFAANGLLDNLPEVVREAITIDGHILKVPATIHADATIYYNRAIAKAVGINPERWTSLEAMWADMPAVRAAGYLPLAIGAQPWQVGYLTHSLVASLGGPTLYQGLYGATPDRAALDDPKLLEVFAWLRRFQQAADPKADGRDWNIATNMVISGQALMQIQGDWMKGEWRAAAKQEDTDYGCLLLPGAKALPVTIDSWGLMGAVPPDIEASERAFADAMVDPRNQAAFAAAKGSTPIRFDAQGEVDRCSRIVLAALDLPQFALPTPHLTTQAAWLADIWDATNAFWQNETMLPEAAVTQLKRDWPIRSDAARK